MAQPYRFGSTTGCAFLSTSGAHLYRYETTWLDRLLTSSLGLKLPVEQPLLVLGIERQDSHWSSARGQSSDHYLRGKCRWLRDCDCDVGREAFGFWRPRLTVVKNSVPVSGSFLLVVSFLPFVWLYVSVLGYRISSCASLLFYRAFSVYFFPACYRSLRSSAGHLVGEGPGCA